MKQIDKQKLHETEWLRQFTLTPEQNKQLVMNKIRRALELQTMVKQREALIPKEYR